MQDPKPFAFEVNRGDGESIKILYSQSKDQFYQLQESMNECSMFVGKAIMKGICAFKLSFRVKTVPRD